MEPLLESKCIVSLSNYINFNLGVFSQNFLKAIVLTNHNE